MERDWQSIGGRLILTPPLVILRTGYFDEVQVQVQIQVLLVVAAATA